MSQRMFIYHGRPFQIGYNDDDNQYGEFFFTDISRKFGPILKRKALRTIGTALHNIAGQKPGNTFKSLKNAVKSEIFGSTSGKSIKASTKKKKKSFTKKTLLGASHTKISTTTKKKSKAAI